MQCISMRDHFNRNQPKNFHRSQFFPQKLKTRPQKAWNAWMKKKRWDLEHLLRNGCLDKAKILKGRRVFVKRLGLDWERRERYQDTCIWNDLDWTSDIYRKMQLDRLRRYRWQNRLDRSWRCQVAIEQTETLEKRLNGLGYLLRGIAKTQKI